MKGIYGIINSLNEHCWKQLKATSIKKRSKKSDNEEIDSFLNLQLFFITDWDGFESQT